MPQIVLIDIGSKRPENELGDIVEIQDDNVRLGPAYDVFKVLVVSSMTTTEVKTILHSKIPELQLVYKTAEIADVWTFVEAERKFVWKDGTSWYGLESRPKYPLSLATLTSQDELDLANVGVTRAVKTIILNKCEEKINKNIVNQVEITELRGKIAILRAKNA